MFIRPKMEVITGIQETAKYVEITYTAKPLWIRVAKDRTPPSHRSQVAGRHHVAPDAWDVSSFSSMTALHSLGFHRFLKSNHRSYQGRT